MLSSEFVCHDHQQHATDCGCARNVCSVHNAELTSDGVNLICLYCDWPSPDEGE